MDHLPDEFQLEYADKVSPLWTKLARHLTTRLELARWHLEKALPEDETNRVRGQIRELKAILSLQDDQPIITKGAIDG